MTDRRPFEGAQAYDLASLRDLICKGARAEDEGFPECGNFFTFPCHKCIFDDQADPALFREWLKGLISREEGK